MRNLIPRIAFGLLLALPVWCGPRAAAAVRPHGLFTNGVVLQQGAKVPVWGTAADGEKVTVSIQGNAVVVSSPHVPVRDRQVSSRGEAALDLSSAECLSQALPPR